MVFKGKSGKMKNADVAIRTRKGGVISSEKSISESVTRRQRKDMSRERRKMVLVRHQLEKIKSDYEVKENKLRVLEQNMFNRNDASRNSVEEERNIDQAQREKIYNSLQYDVNSGGSQLRDVFVKESGSEREGSDKSETSSDTSRATQKHSNGLAKNCDSSCADTMVASSHACDKVPIIQQQNSGKDGLLLGHLSELSIKQSSRSTKKRQIPKPFINDGISPTNSFLSRDVEYEEDPGAGVKGFLNLPTVSDPCNSSFNLVETVVLTIGESVSKVFDATVYREKKLPREKELSSGDSSSVTNSLPDKASTLKGVNVSTTFTSEPSVSNDDSGKNGYCDNNFATAAYAVTPKINNFVNDVSECREPLSPCSQRLELDNLFPYDSTCGGIIEGGTQCDGREEVDDETVDCKLNESGNDNNAIQTSDSSSISGDYPSTMLMDKKGEGTGSRASGTVGSGSIEVELDEVEVQNKGNSLDVKKKKLSFFRLRKNKLKVNK